MPASNLNIFNERKNSMKIKTNVKAGGVEGDIRIGS